MLSFLHPTSPRSSPPTSNPKMSEASNNDAEPRVSVKIVDMENRKALYAQQICRELILSGRGNEKAVAAQLKRDFDDAFGGTWHCIVGASFGGNVTHRENHFLYFFVENFAVMLFKSA